VVAETVARGSELRITLKTPLNFYYKAFEKVEEGHQVTVYGGHRVDISGVNFRINGARGFVQIVGTKNSTINGIALTRTGDAARDGLILAYSVDSTISNARLSSLYAGVGIAASRNISVSYISSQNCIHPIVPSNFSDTVHVNGLEGVNNLVTMDAHPSFNIHYNGVKAKGDRRYSNLRSIGGSIRNSTFSSTNSDPNYSSSFQSLELADPSIYAEYDFDIENVVWEAPYAKGQRQEGVNIFYGRNLSIRNLTAPALTIADVTASQFETVIIENSTLGIIYTNQKNTQVRDSILDGSISPYYSDGLLILGHRSKNVIFSNTIFKNHKYVVWKDYDTDGMRKFHNCKFKNLTRFDLICSYGFPVEYNRYEFQDCNFISMSCGNVAELFSCPQINNQNLVIKNSLFDGQVLDPHENECPNRCGTPSPCNSFGFYK
jgi:hypothetical protein